MPRDTILPASPGLAQAAARAVPKSPVLRSAMLRRRPGLPPSLDSGAAVSLWYSGRAAIYQGVRRLGLEAGSRVLAPAYCCGSEMDALLKAGLSVDLYRLGPDLAPDRDDLERLARTDFAAIYVTHYFGVVQDMAPLAAVASRNGARVIEDAALCLYGRAADGTPAGHAGDIGIFSLVKFLPLPDGGALVERTAPAAGRAGSGEAGRGPAWRAVLGRAKGVFRASAGLGRAGGRVSAPAAEIGPREDQGGLDPARASWTISPPSRLLLRHWDHDRIAELRRRNARRLASLIEEGRRVRPLFPSWPDGAVPPFFPVVAEDAQAFHAYLKAKGIGAVRFWYARHPLLPLDRFPFESGLKNSVVRLPIHQDVGGGDLDRMARLVNDWNAGS